MKKSVIIAISAVFLLILFLISCTKVEVKVGNKKTAIGNATNISNVIQETKKYDPCVNVTGNDARADSPKRGQWEECWEYNNPGITPSSW